MSEVATDLVPPRLGWVIIESFGEDGLGDVVGTFSSREQAEYYAKKLVESGRLVNAEVKELELP